MKDERDRKTGKREALAYMHVHIYHRMYIHMHIRTYNWQMYRLNKDGRMEWDECLNDLS